MGGEAHSPSSMKSSVKFPQSVMICGATTSAGVGPVDIQQSLTRFIIETEITKKSILDFITLFGLNQEYCLMLGYLKHHGSNKF